MSTAALTAAKMFVTHLEKVRSDDLEEAFDSADSVAALLKSRVTKDNDTSDKLYRWPIKTARGAAYGAFNPDGGGLGRGAGPEYEEFKFSRHYSKMAVEWTYKASKSSDSNQKAVAKAEEAITDALEELQVMADIEAHGRGDGKLVHDLGASAATADDGGVTSYVFAYAADDLGVVNLRRGMWCRVFSNNGQTQRYNSAAGATAAFRITKVDPASKKIYLDKQVDSTSPTTGDLLVFDGVNANLTYGANYSGTPPLHPDSWRHGIKYYNDASTSNYMGGVLKSTVPEIVANHLPAGNAYMSHLLIQQLLDMIFIKRDDKQRQQLVGIMSLAGKYSLIEKLVDLTSWQRSKQVEDALDLIPANLSANDGVFTICGVTHMVSKRQNGSRCDYIAPRMWERNRGFKTDWYMDDQGRKIFPAYGTDGAPAAAWLAYLVQSFDYACADPAKAGYISGMSRPDGY